MLKAELIEKNKNLIQQNGELMYLLEFGKLICEDSGHQMIWELDSNAKVLQQKIQKQKEVIDKAVKYIDDLRDESAERQGFYNCFPDDLYIPDINELLDILKEVS